MQVSYAIFLLSVDVFAFPTVIVITVQWSQFCNNYV